METNKISEIQIVPIKPASGLVAFASVVFDSKLYLGSIGIMTRPQGGYRLVYPTKKISSKNINVFYPINRQIAQMIENEVIKKFEDVMNQDHDRHNQVKST